METVYYLGASFSGSEIPECFFGYAQVVVLDTIMSISHGHAVRPFYIETNTLDDVNCELVGAPVTIQAITYPEFCILTIHNPRDLEQVFKDMYNADWRRQMLAATATAYDNLRKLAYRHSMRVLVAL